MAFGPQISRAGAFLHHLRVDSTGNALAMMAAAMVPLAGMIGGGLDMSRVYMARAKLQTACDAGALAGRQGMVGTDFEASDRASANKFFNFNFPVGTMNASNVTFAIDSHPTDTSALQASATADVPTSLMRIFGKKTMAVRVTCDAKLDLGANDLMLVLDVTGSMLCAPGVTGTCTESTDSKIRKLRDGALGLYRALDTGDAGQTRYGIMPYSGTVNVAKHLTNNMIVTNMQYPDCDGYGNVSTPAGAYYGCNSAKYDNVHINNTSWKVGGGGSGFFTPSGSSIANWRGSGEGCIEERSSRSSQSYPPRIQTTVTQDDIDYQASSWVDLNAKWGRYDWEEWSAYVKAGTKTRSAPSAITDAPYWQVACPSEAKKLQAYGNESDYSTAIDEATARVTGGTYHDIGMIWGMRYISPTGIFSASNPTDFAGYPVNKHIIFMTDGLTDTQTNPWYYSAYGVNAVESRMEGVGNSDELHVARFQSACAMARSMNITVWVIALDVADTSDVEPCATSTDHFYTSDGSDLEDVFAQIGQAVGDLRLTS